MTAGLTPDEIEPPTPIGAKPPEPEKPTPGEVMDTLTGYDEIAIEKAFGADIETLINAGKGLTYLRALVFAQELHDGAKHEEAKRTALSLPSKDLADRFLEPEDDDDLPGSETGKDGT